MMTKPPTEAAALLRNYPADINSRDTVCRLRPGLCNSEDSGSKYCIVHWSHENIDMRRVDCHNIDYTAHDDDYMDE